MDRGLKLEGSRVLITGGASGIGHQMALEAARRSAAEVIIWDLAAERAIAVCAEIAAAGGRARAFTVNVADRDAVRAAADETGPVDILIHSAGVVTGEKLLDATDEAIERTFDVNVLGLYWVARAFLGDMLERDRGVLVTIASAAGLVGVARQTDYSASKFAAVGFTESLRNELRRDGSTVGTLLVCPYYINTGMFDGVTTKFRRLLPILDQTEVAIRILDAVESGRKQLILPRLPGLLPGLRLLPVRVFDRIVDFFGVNNTMDRFTGRARTPSERRTGSARRRLS